MLGTEVFFTIVGGVLLEVMDIAVKQCFNSIEIRDDREKDEALLVLGVVLTDAAALANKKGSVAVVLVTQGGFGCNLGELVEEEIELEGVWGKLAGLLEKVRFRS